MLHIDSFATQRFSRYVHGAGGLVVLASVVAVYALLYAPTMEATEQAHREIDALRQSLQAAPGIHREHARLSEELRQMELRLAGIRRRVPRQAEDSEFISALTGLAGEVELIITNLSPSPAKKMDGYSQMDIVVTGLASYESLCRFVQGVSDFPRLAKVVSLDVRTDTSGAGVYPVTVTFAIFYDLAASPAEEGE